MASKLKPKPSLSQMFLEATSSLNGDLSAEKIRDYTLQKYRVDVTRHLNSVNMKTRSSEFSLPTIAAGTRTSNSDFKTKPKRKISRQGASKGSTKDKSRSSAPKKKRPLEECELWVEDSNRLPLTRGAEVSTRGFEETPISPTLEKRSSSKHDGSADARKRITVGNDVRAGLEKKAFNRSRDGNAPADPLLVQQDQAKKSESGIVSTVIKAGSAIKGFIRGFSRKYSSSSVSVDSPQPAADNRDNGGRLGYDEAFFDKIFDEKIVNDSEKTKKRKKPSLGWEQNKRGKTSKIAVREKQRKLTTTDKRSKGNARRNKSSVPAPGAKDGAITTRSGLVISRHLKDGKGASKKSGKKIDFPASKTKQRPNARIQKDKPVVRKRTKKK